MTINDYRCKLINKILLSASQDDVKRYIDAAMKDLVQHKLNGHLISRFVEKTSKDLVAFNPMDYESQQWDNIKMARAKFNEIKHSMHSGDDQ